MLKEQDQEEVNDTVAKSKSKEQHQEDVSGIMVKRKSKKSDK